MSSAICLGNYTYPIYPVGDYIMKTYALHALPWGGGDNAAIMQVVIKGRRLPEIGQILLPSSSEVT